MKKKIYFIQPTYRTRDGRLLQGARVFMHSLAIPALSAARFPGLGEANLRGILRGHRLRNRGKSHRHILHELRYLPGIRDRSRVQEARENGDLRRRHGSVMEACRCSGCGRGGVRKNPGPLEMKEILDDAERAGSGASTGWE
jgi:hypothetical protein